MSKELVVIKIENSIAEVYLNRAEKHNSLTLEMFSAIADAGQSLQENRDIRVAILHGAGPSFCAGLDFSLMTKILEQGSSGDAVIAALIGKSGQNENLAQRVAMIWQQVDFPVIAAIDGAAFGGGFQIAMGCDFRIASPNAKFSIMELHYGLVPDMGITKTLPGILRKDQALELALTARQFDAKEALQLGVVTKIEKDYLGKARELAAEISARSPDAVRGCKKLINTAWKSSPDDSLELEALIQGQLLGSPDQRESVLAAMEKRSARF